jgi:membrane protease subunit HflK
LPWPIESVRRTDVKRSRQMPLGYRLIDEVNGIEPTERRKQWLTGDTNIVELKATVLYRVSDARAWLYGVSGVRTPGAEDMTSRSFALRLLGESALTYLVAELTIDEVLTSGAARVAPKARLRIQEGADLLGLGVIIDSVEMKDSKPPLNVRRDFTAVESARQEKERVIATARADADLKATETRSRVLQIQQEAQSASDRELAEARGRASAFADLVKAVGSADSPAARKLYFDYVQRILAGATIRTVPAGTPERPTRVYLDN